jgi:hypothetical protein
MNCRAPWGITDGAALSGRAVSGALELASKQQNPGIVRADLHDDDEDSWT